MTKRKPLNILISLIFPLFNIIATALVFLLIGIINGRISPYGWALIASFVIGGIIPIFLTTVCRIDTSEYIKGRLISFTLSMLTCFFTFFAVMYSGHFFIFFFFPLVPLVISTLHFRGEARKTSEWLVLFLSDPTLHIVIQVIILFVILLSVGLISFIP